MKVIDQTYQWAYTPATRSKTTHLILHHAAATTASVQDVHGWHLAQGWAGIGYHYYVRKYGVIYRGRHEVMTGSHTLNMNHTSLGICFEGNFDQEEMPLAQKKAGYELIADIQARYPGIQVTRHRDHQATACPGSQFPLTQLLDGSGLLETSASTAQTAQDDYKIFVSNLKQYEKEVDAQPQSTWAEAVCSEAVALGLFQGDPNGNMRWRSPVTREELAALLIRVLTVKEK